MNKQKATTAKADAQFGKRKILVRLGITIAVTLAALVGLYIVIDYPYRHNFSTVYNEVEKVRRDVIAPAGGVEWKGGTYTPKFNGNGWLSSLGCIDINCPSVSRMWFVPIEPNKDSEFVRITLQREGYQQQSGFGGVKGGLNMSVTINSTGPIAPPAAAPGGKEWRFVQVDVYMSHQ